MEIIILSSNYNSYTLQCDDSGASDKGHSERGALGIVEWSGILEGILESKI